MRRPTQRCLFESDRPCWRELETSLRDTLLHLMEQMLLQAGRRAAVAKRESEVSDDDRQDHV
jgi:hypothetical protein